MTRVYSDVTGAYLGLIWQRFDHWYTEDRLVNIKRHTSEDDGIRWLQRQPEHAPETAA